jgi:NADPH:quinone reductase-like Zn-dependent oxidoreductase
MRAAIVRQYGRVTVEERAKPEPAEGEVLVRVHASSVNAVDWYGLNGRPYAARAVVGLRNPKSDRLGSDFAGVVVAAAGTDHALAAGEEVYGVCGGAFAEYVAVADAIARKPANMSFEEAATVPVAALTALQGFRDHARLQPGQRVLVNGAAGGVGTFAVQVATALGAEVHAVCSTANVGQAAELGATRVFDYTCEDFTRSDVKYDVVFDNAGTRSWRAMCRVLTPTATVVLVGGPRNRRLLGPLGHVARITLASKLSKRQAHFFIAKPNHADLAVLRDLIERGQVRAVIEHRHELGEIAAAIRRLDSGHAGAKTVVLVEQAS